MAYRLHNDFMGIFVGRQNTPQNHALAGAYAKFTADMYYAETLLTNDDTGEKKHDAIFIARGLYALPRPPSVKRSGVRRNTVGTVILALRQNYDYDAEDFENGHLTPAGKAKITAIVVAADETRTMPPDETDSAPTVQPADSDSE